MAVYTLKRQKESALPGLVFLERLHEFHPGKPLFIGYYLTHSSLSYRIKEDQEDGFMKLKTKYKEL